MHQETPLRTPKTPFYEKKSGPKLSQKYFFYKIIILFSLNLNHINMVFVNHWGACGPPTPPAYLGGFACEWVRMNGWWL